MGYFTSLLHCDIEALSKERKTTGSTGSVLISTITPPWSSFLPLSKLLTCSTARDEEVVDIDLEPNSPPNLTLILLIPVKIAKQVYLN